LGGDQWADTVDADERWCVLGDDRAQSLLEAGELGVEIGDALGQLA
jgi:hypothetical protein